MVQWNVHGECFTACNHSSDKHCDHHYPACKQNATTFVTELLAGTNTESPDVPDFVGLEEWGDTELLSSSLDSDKWSYLSHTCGGNHGEGVWPWDSAFLIYNTKKWEIRKTGNVTQDSLGGCMERVKDAPVNLQVSNTIHRYKRSSLLATARNASNASNASTEANVSSSDDKNSTASNTSSSDEENSTALQKAKAKAKNEKNYRAFFMQAFKHKTDGTELIAVVAHYPHTYAYESEIGPLKEAINTMQQQTGLKKVIFMMDSNWRFPDIEASDNAITASKTSASIVEDLNASNEDTVSSEPHHTCCEPKYFATYDRIIATGFPGSVDPVTTYLPFGDTVPSWMAFNMHKPIAGRLEYTAGNGSVDLGSYGNGSVHLGSRASLKIKNGVLSSASLNVAAAIFSAAMLAF
jgi:hypothetical protein